MSQNRAKKIKQNKKSETTQTGTIGDFVATFASLRPLEASKSIRAPNAQKKFQPVFAISEAERPQNALRFLKQKPTFNLIEAH